MIYLSASGISRCYFLNGKKLKTIVSFILKYKNIRDATLSVVFTTDKRIKRLNYLYRKKNRPTDVLAFSMQEGALPSFVKTVAGKRLRRESSILGDIVISVDRAKRQAKIFNSTLEREIYLYIIHGILHLIGYDDEKPSLQKSMQKKESEILNALLCKISKKRRRAG